MGKLSPYFISSLSLVLLFWYNIREKNSCKNNLWVEKSTEEQYRESYPLILHLFAVARKSLESPSSSTEFLFGLRALELIKFSVWKNSYGSNIQTLFFSESDEGRISLLEKCDSSFSFAKRVFDYLIWVAALHFGLVLFLQFVAVYKVLRLHFWKPFHICKKN